MMFGANATVSVYKLNHGVKTSTYPGTATLTGVEAYIESQKPSLMQALSGQNNLESFDMFCDPIAIAAGDKVVDDQGREYRVAGVERHQNNGDIDDIIKVTLNAQHVIPT